MIVGDQPKAYVPIEYFTSYALMAEIAKLWVKLQFCLKAPKHTA